jgi:hypothetical protein
MRFILDPNNMEKKDTNDIFKKILEQPPPMLPDMEALKDMHRRLDEHEERKAKEKSALLWWLIPLCVLPFLFSSMYFFSKYQTAQKNLEILNSQLAQNHVNLKASAIDTLTQRITIYEYDTILNTIYQDQIINRKKSKSSFAAREYAFISSLSPSLRNEGTQPHIDAINTFKYSSIQPFHPELHRAGKVLSTNQLVQLLHQEQLAIASETNNLLPKNKAVIAPPLPPVAFLNSIFKLEQPLPEVDFTTYQSDAKRSINPLWHLTPVGFHVGLNLSSVGFTKISGLNSYLFNIGLAGEIEFIQNARLQVGFDYLTIDLETESPEEISRFPPITPDDPSDRLKEVNGDFAYLQIPITFRYIFPTHKKWKPVIGVGMTSILPISENLEYEFISQQRGDYDIKGSVNSTSFSTKNIRGILGFEYKFSKKYSLQTEAYYNYGFEENENLLFNARYGGLNLGLKYKL